MAQVTEERRRNMARKELAWLSRGAQARSTKPKFRVEAARELIADVPPVRNELELKRLAVSRLGKQVIDVIDVDAGYASSLAAVRGSKEGTSSLGAPPCRTILLLWAIPLRRTASLPAACLLTPWLWVVPFFPM